MVCKIILAGGGRVSNIFILDISPHASMVKLEAGTNKNVQVRLMDADGKRILEVGTHLKLPQPAPGEVIKSNHILNLNNVAFENPGDYAFCILINGEEKRSVPLKLVKIEQ